MKQNKIKFLIIGIVILLVVGLILMLFSNHSKKDSEKAEGNQYHVSEDTKKEEDGVETYTNSKLEKAHCLDSICIENVVFYYKDNEGRIDYSIENRSDKTVTGNLKIVFGEQSLVAVYNNLAAHRKINTSSYFVNMVISNKEDYTLEKLSKEDKGNIVVIEQ